jgi:lipocalin-like protein
MKLPRRQFLHLAAAPVALLAWTQTHPTPLLAAEPSALIGSWKLVSWQVIAEDGTMHDLYGAKPKGYLVLTREGRSIAVTTADGRKPGMGDADRAALHKSMVAYSGRYRIEGNDFITTVEVSWNEAWDGTEQRRHFRIEGDRLFIETAPAPSIIFPGKTDFRRIVLERDK